MLVGDLADVRVAPKCLRRDGSHQVDENQLEGVVDLAISRLGEVQLGALSHDAHVTVWHGSFEAYPIVVQLSDDVQAFVVEVLQSSVPPSGFSRSLHYQLLSADLVGEIQRERVEATHELLK